MSAATIRYSRYDSDEALDACSFEKTRRHQRVSMPASCCRSRRAGAKKTAGSRRANRIASQRGGMHHRRIRDLFEPRLWSWLVMLGMALAADQAHAVPIFVQSAVIQPFPCENSPLVPPISVDELGAGFPPNERIGTLDQFSPMIVCNNPAGVVSTQVDIINTVVPPASFTDLWYVASNGTSFTNWEILVNGNHAMKIDSVGTHQPLIFESQVADGIFAPGEMWSFILEGYFNTNNLPAMMIQTPGVVGMNDFNSSGSIIALPHNIPEPSTIALATLGAIGIVASRTMRRRRGWLRSLVAKAAALVAAVGFQAAVAPSSAHAVITGLFNTGVNNANVPQAPLSAELHYTLIASADPNCPTTLPPIVEGRPNTFTWVNFNNAISEWIRPQQIFPGFPPIDNFGICSNGTYIYRTTFTATGGETIIGRVSADDLAVSIDLNSNPVAAPNVGFASYQNFTITNIPAGLNTLDFVVQNLGGPPTGLRVEMTGIPEPSTVGVAALTLGGLAGAAAVRRRRARRDPKNA